jgi:hypothetical protein
MGLTTAAMSSMPEISRRDNFLILDWGQFDELVSAVT